MRATRLPGRSAMARLVRSDPDEDRRLAQIEGSRFLERGIPLLLLGFTVGAMVGVFITPHGDYGVGSRALAAGLLAVVALTLAPLELLGFLPGRETGFTLGSLAYDSLVLIPTAGLGIAGLMSYIDLGLGWILMGFVVVSFAAGHVLTSVRRKAAGVTAASFVVTMMIAAADARLHDSPIPLVIWPVAFAFVLVVMAGIRNSSLAMVEVREAREALAQQTMADERRQIARDVHDVVAHTLAVTMLHITAARMAVRRSSPSEAEDALEEAERHGRASLGDIRRIVRLLRADHDDGTSAVDAAQPGLADIDGLVDGYRAAGLHIDLTRTGDAERASPAAGLAVYRVLQEALANAARHGDGPATVDLQTHNGEMVLSIENPVRDPALRPMQGSGLLGMRERIAAAGGTVDAGIDDSRWVVRARVPFGAAPDTRDAQDVRRGSVGQWTVPSCSGSGAARKAREPNEAAP